MSDGWQDGVLHDCKVVYDHAAMVSSGAFVSRGLECVAVEGVEREVWSVVLAAGYFIVDRFHLAVDRDLDLSQHSV